MAKLFCCVLIVVVGSLNSSIAANHAVSKTNLHSAINKQKNRGKIMHPTPLTIWKGIKAAAQDEVQSNSPFLIAPRFTVKQIGSSPQLTIVRGDVVGLPSSEDDPYQLPFKKQILIEALRSSLVETDLSITKASTVKRSSRQASGEFQMMKAGQPYLAEAESLVRKMVVDIETESDKNLLLEKLSGSEKEIDDTLEKVYEAVEQVAKRDRYNIIYGRGGENPTKFSVPIVRVPDDAQVFIMHAGTYKIHQRRGTAPSQFPWIEITQSPYPLMGKYHYLIISAGKRRESTIEVANNSPIRFQAN